MPEIAVPAPLLPRGRHFTSTDYQAVRRHVEASTRGVFAFSVRDPCEFHGYAMRSARLGETAFRHITVESRFGYAIEVQPDPDLLLLQVPMRGSVRLQQGRTALDARPAQLLVLEGQERLRKHWHGPTEVLMVQISRARLQAALARETGMRHEAALDFGRLQVMGLERVPTLWNTLVTICRDLGSEAPCLQGPAGLLAERMLFALLLDLLPGGESARRPDEAPSPAVPHYVRRVERFIRDHAREPIGIAELLRAGGASPRSIYAGFRRFRGTTPLDCLKAVRLDLAREALRRDGQGRGGVTEAALAVGYANLSQFSRDYRARFGETPSQTLARG